PTCERLSLQHLRPCRIQRSADGLAQRGLPKEAYGALPGPKDSEPRRAAARPPGHSPHPGCPDSGDAARFPPCEPCPARAGRTMPPAPSAPRGDDQPLPKFLGDRTITSYLDSVAFPSGPCCLRDPSLSFLCE